MIRDSGMPDRQAWESFFDPADILRRLRFQPGAGDVVDLGCGYGTFSIAAAQLTGATVHALDIDPLMIETTIGRARSLGLSNVRAIERNVVTEGTGLADACVAFAMLFNVLHAENPTVLLQEAFRILRPRGLLGIIHWVHEASTPRGPDLSIRPRPEQCRDWARQVGFVSEEPPISLPPHHYGLVLRKPG
ncbi:MAG TPA: methyltransferase domain-containing protein [Steroidobacteraceae bacterium]|jgi:SAM-dependent methyltransferase|nr:methyltransferase domain-containing protein [Steroidobacteraceae bacterium]